MPQSDDPANNAFPINLGGNPNPPEEIDALFVCLADYRRRAVLERLSEGADPIAIEELVDGVARHVGVGTASTSRDDQKADIDISLVHNHLPKLEDAGVVEVNSETRTVQRGDRFETARTLLEAV